MRFATLLVDGFPRAAVLVPSRGWLPLERLDPSLPSELLTLIEQAADRELVQQIESAVSSGADELVEPESEVRFAAPYQRPHKIWGIGLNYSDHAADLSAALPDQPASFIKADHTVIGPGQSIRLPPQSQRVTAEAELGLVIGRPCYQVSEEEALPYVFGFCAILDQTAEDILALNPRYLTRAKNFPTFFSFGPEIATADELLSADPTLGAVGVATWLNGEERRASSVAQMTHSPAKLISFHSQMMPFYPGDIISTGTPGAVVIADGDVAESRVGSLTALVNPVRGDRAPAGGAERNH
jgi:2-keto-4-pentenoate hydratase/2-oxohepta-3-ene-1,7-dioic acid hydratase in catechol pathway